MKFSIKDFFSKCDQIRSFLWIWSTLLEKSLMEKFIFCAVFTICGWVQILYCCQRLTRILILRLTVENMHTFPVLNHKYLWSYDCCDTNFTATVQYINPKTETKVKSLKYKSQEYKSTL